MIKLGVHIHVKFRAFGITFGEVDRCVLFGFSQRGPILLGYPEKPPAGAKLALSERGVTVRWWMA